MVVMCLTSASPWVLFLETDLPPHNMRVKASFRIVSFFTSDSFSDFKILHTVFRWRRKSHLFIFRTPRFRNNHTETVLIKPLLGQ